jgi:hypothetical protein
MSVAATPGWRSRYDPWSAQLMPAPAAQGYAGPGDGAVLRLVEQLSGRIQEGRS